MRIIDILIYILVFAFVIGGCSSPWEPEPPPDDPCEQCPPQPCDPVPCEPVPCETVRVEGVWHIEFGKDKSAPNYGGLLQNEVAIWDTVDVVPGSGEFGVLVPGNFHPSDKIEAFTRGSRSRMRYWFEAN